jgi:biopolymer transport protein ExbD/biopolymer transport protein TolR
MALRTLDDDGDLPESHEINVTPFIDVMLVLLIIFMVAAPLATVEVPVELPSSTAAAPPPEQPVYLTLQADLGLRLGDTRVDRGRLKPALDRATHGDLGQRVYLHADKSVPYEALMATMDALRDAGYLKVALVGQEHGRE